MIFKRHNDQDAKKNKFQVSSFKFQVFWSFLFFGLLFLILSLAPIKALAATLPGAPNITSVVAGDGQATINFSPTTTGETDIKSYTVTSNPGNLISTGKTSPLTVTGLTNDTKYTFTVYATNSATENGGNGPKSAPSSAITPTVIAVALDTTAFAAYVKNIFFHYAIPLAVGGAILMFAVGGLMIIYSGGDASKIQNGKDIITGTIIGLILMLLASIILGAIDPTLGNYLKP